MSHLSEAILRDTNGLTLHLRDTAVIAMMRDYADFFLIDAAARPASPGMIAAAVAAAGNMPVLVRVENIAPSCLQAYLALGVDGLVLTGIQYAAEAEKAIISCLYPPEGVRPYRGIYHKDAVSLQALNDQITLIVEIATPQAVTQIAEICEVTGINGVLVSPQRLAVAMEHGFDAENSAVQAGIRHVCAVAKSYELPFGLEGDGFDSAGYDADFSIRGSDTGFLAKGLAQVFPAPVMTQGAYAAPDTLENRPVILPAFAAANDGDEDGGTATLSGLVARRE